MEFVLTTSRVLLVGGEGVVLYGPTAKGVERETSISWEVPNFDEQLAEAFGGKYKSKSVVVLFDGADQTYRKEENIPKMSALDRSRFVKRKLELAFPSYPIRASLEVKPPKRKSKGRLGAKAKPAKDPAKSYLFVALPETDQLDRIGGALLESGVPARGFGLLPLESAGLVDELSDKVFAGGKKSRWAVLVGQHETGGLRQVVIKDGNLALTRLTPTSEAGVGGNGWVEEVTREFKATLTYISRFGYNNDDGLDVIIICGDTEKQFFDQKAIPVTNFRCINVSEALRLLGRKSFGQEQVNFADAVHAAWVGWKGGLRLPVRVPSIHRIMAPRLAARVGGILLALGIVGLIGISLQDYQQYRGVEQDIQEKQIQKQSLDREYEDESKQFEQLPVKPAVVKSALAIKKVLEANTVSLRPVFHLLKNTLPSDVRLEKISLTHAAGSALPVDGALAASTSPFRFGAAADTSNEKGKVSIEFSFTLPDALTLEQKIHREEDLEKTLQDAFKGWEVRRGHQFENVSEQGAMQNTLGQPPSGGPSGSSGQGETASIEMTGAPLP